MIPAKHRVQPDSERVLFLRQRAETLIEAKPGLAELRSRLLAIGGIEVVLFSPEFDLPALLGRGMGFSTEGSKLRRMRANGCHANAASLWSASKGQVKIATGYGLSDDGLWRQHSWGLLDGRIIETTCRRIRYFGYELTGEEALGFANADADQSLASRMMPSGAWGGTGPFERTEEGPGGHHRRTGRPR